MRRKRERNSTALWRPAGRAGARLAAVLLALLLLAGCGSARPAKAAGGAALRMALPAQNAGRKAPSLLRLAFGPELPWQIRAVSAIYTEHIDSPRSPLHELGLFDLTGDGVPELMAFNYGAWMGHCVVYDLAGQEPVWVGSMEWPPTDPERVWSKPAEGGTAWRIDFQTGHSIYLDRFSNMVFPAEDGLHLVVCWEGIDTEDMTEWKPLEWNYTVAHYLVRDGWWQIRREEEWLTFVPDERLAALAAENPEETARFLPASEMEAVLEGSLYWQLLNDGWTGAEVPWVLEHDLGPDGKGWISLDLVTRCQRLYAAWEKRQGPITS